MSGPPTDLVASLYDSVRSVEERGGDGANGSYGVEERRLAPIPRPDPELAMVVNPGLRRNQSEVLGISSKRDYHGVPNGLRKLAILASLLVGGLMIYGRPWWCFGKTVRENLMGSWPCSGSPPPPREQAWMRSASHYQPICRPKRCTVRSAMFAKRYFVVGTMQMVRTAANAARAVAAITASRSWSRGVPVGYRPRIEDRPQGLGRPIPVL